MPRGQTPRGLVEGGTIDPVRLGEQAHQSFGVGEDRLDVAFGKRRRVIT